MSILMNAYSIGKRDSGICRFSTVVDINYSPYYLIIYNYLFQKL